MTEEYHDEYHVPEYNEFCQPVDFERVFEKPVTDYVETLLTVRKIMAGYTWTETLTDLFEGILWSQMSPRGWANYYNVSIESATVEFNHAYRVLKNLANNGWIEAL